MSARTAAAVGVLALALRAPRVVLRWDEVALAYAAYPAPTVEALSRGELAVAATTWMGLHPPGWPLLHAASELLAPVPGLWLLGSVVASAAAAGLVALRAGPWAGLVLATAPLQVSYAAEVNNYPLAVFSVALLLALSKARWVWLALAAVLAGWSHLLSGVIAAAVVFHRLPSLPRRDALRLAGACGLGAAPLVAGLWKRAHAAGTFGQAPVEVLDWMGAVVGGVGWLGLGLGAVALLAFAVPRRDWVAAGVGLVAAYGLALWTGAAAGHQLPYLLFFGPLAAVGVGQAAERWRGLAWGVGAACVVRGALLLPQLTEVRSLVADPPRAVDQVLSSAAEGDVVWLVAPALQPDDDKTATSPVLARLGPWTSMPMDPRVPFEYRDWRYGQPRRWRGRTVHTSTELYAAPFDQVAAEALGRGASLWVVLYEHGPATGLDLRVERVLQPYTTTQTVWPVEQGLGDDRLWQVTGRTP